MMNINSQNASEITNELNFNFWLDTSFENQIVYLFNNSIHQNLENSSLQAWIDNTVEQVNQLEQLLYNSYHLCPTLYNSIVSKITGCNTVIDELNKSLTINNVELSKAAQFYHKQLLAVQQKIQVALLYINV